MYPIGHTRTLFSQSGDPLIHFPQQFPVLGFGLMYLSPRLHFGLMHLTVAQIFGRLQPAVNGFFLQYFRTDMPALHARHDAIFALQQERGLHIGFLHPFFIIIHDRTEPPLQGARRYTGQCTFLQNRLLHIVLRPSLRQHLLGLHIGFLQPFFILIHERTEPPLQGLRRYFGQRVLQNRLLHI